MASSTQLKQTVNVTSKRWWIQYAQGFIITAIVVIFLSAMTGNIRDIGIGAGILVLFTVIGLFASIRKYGLWDTIRADRLYYLKSASKATGRDKSFDSGMGTASGY